MPFPDNAEELKALLSLCAVRIEHGAGHGTGFFVAPGVVLTCYHVVKNEIASGEKVTAVASDNRPLTGTVRADGHRGPGWPDLALIDVDADDLPCVVLDQSQVPGDAPLVAGGYPKESQVVYQTRPMKSGGEVNYDRDRRPFLRLDDDPLVGGMSGSPVLNLDTGFVCAIVRLTMDEQQAVGGFATPMSTVLRELPVLRDAYDRPGDGAREWTRLLGPVHLKRFQRNHDGGRWEAEEGTSRVDLNLVRDEPPESPLNKWRVAIPSDEIVSDWVQGTDLGADVMEAVNSWSQRHTFGSRIEADLLGKMLYRALLPQAIEKLVETKSKSSVPVLLRVRVDRASRLAQIPWEYALKSNEDDPVATRPSMAFSRYVDTESAGVQLADNIRVLVVVVRPPEFRRRSRPHGSGGAADAATTSQLAATVADTLARTDRIDGTVLTDVSIDAFSRHVIEDGPWDIIHYIGAGWEGGGPQDDATLGFWSQGEVTQIPLRSVVQTISSHEYCRLVVVQLLSVPADGPRHPLGVVSLLPLLEKGVQALVVGQHAATSQHLSSFSQRFYSALAEGDAVEFAVQKARRFMRLAPPELDYTAFGTVTVTTTRSGELRLLTPSASRGRDSRRDPSGARSTPTDARRPGGSSIITR